MEARYLVYYWHEPKRHLIKIGTGRIKNSQLRMNDYAEEYGLEPDGI